MHGNDRLYIQYIWSRSGGGVKRSPREDTKGKKDPQQTSSDFSDRAAPPTALYHCAWYTGTLENIQLHCTINCAWWPMLLGRLFYKYLHHMGAQFRRIIQQEAKIQAYWWKCVQNHYGGTMWIEAYGTQHMQAWHNGSMASGATALTAE